VYQPVDRGIREADAAVATVRAKGVAQTGAVAVLASFAPGFLTNGPETLGILPDLEELLPAIDCFVSRASYLFWRA
jgi:hypothetical protein